MSLRKVAIVAIAPGGGWNTVRKRWEKHFGEIKDAEFHFYHIEEYARRIHKYTVEKHRLRSLWYLAAGRAAAWEAIKDGCETILIDTYHYAAWAPLVKNVRYFMYGDATARQLTALRPLETNKDNKLPHFIDWLYRKGIARLAGHGTIFLGMSNWYLKGLQEESGVPDEQLVELPFGLDIKHWQRQELNADADPKMDLNFFLSAILSRKRADIFCRKWRRCRSSANAYFILSDVRLILMMKAIVVTIIIYKRIPENCSSFFPVVI